MRRIYMDHAAATPIEPKVAKAMHLFESVQYGNPSAIHKEGVFARNAILNSRTTIAELLGVHADEIVFTGSATESANLAVMGAVRVWQKTNPQKVAHIIMSAIEHSAVSGPVQELKNEGARVSVIPVDKDGLVDPTAIRNALTEETVLVSVMYANNEIGTIEPIREIAKVLRKWKRDNWKADGKYPLFHTDAAQAANYLDMYVPRLGVDLMTLNAAKVYGPKGVGLLYSRRGVELSPIIVGGGQERGLRSGTENVAGIVGFAEAFKTARKISEKESKRLTKIRDYCITILKKAFPEIVINGSVAERLPNNVNFTLPNIDPRSTTGVDYGASHEFLVIALDAKGIACSTKSACNEQDAETSHVLLALREASGSKLPPAGIRLSFGRATKKEDISVLIKALKEIMNKMVVST